MLTTNPKNLEVNKGDQFIIAYDISRSMETTDCRGGMSRLGYVRETLLNFTAEAAKFDPDGVSIYLFGHAVQAFPDLKAEDVAGKLANIVTEGATQTHLVIQAAYEEHKAKGTEQTFLLLFTDGEPSDGKAVRDTIIGITKAVKDPAEFRIAFITVGARSAELNQYLTDLDDNLTSAGAAHDIVDVKDIDSVDFMAAVNGALTD